MSLDKISLTLYDFVGYLLPGYVLVFACSALEATFLPSDLFSLSKVSENPLTFAVVAYFFGYIVHSIGSVLKDRWHRWRKSALRSRVRKSLKRVSGGRIRFDEHRKSEHQADPVFTRVHDALVDAFELHMEPNTKLDPLHVYMLADSYVVASGGSAERDAAMLWQRRDATFR